MLLRDGRASTARRTSRRPGSFHRAIWIKPLCRRRPPAASGLRQPELQARRHQGRRHEVPGQPRDQVRRRLREHQRHRSTASRAAPVSASTTSPAVYRDHLLPSPVLRQRSGARLQPHRSVDLVDPAPLLEATPETQNASFYAQDSYKVRSNLVDQPRLPLGAAARAGPRRGRRIDAQQQLGAAPRRRLGSDRQTARRRSTRTGAASTRTSRWTSTSARSAASPAASATTSSPERSNTTPLSATPLREFICSAARPNRSIPNLKGQYIDEALVGYEYEVAPNFAARRPGHLP